jgi:hypothetical protein
MENIKKIIAIDSYLALMYQDTDTLLYRPMHLILR